MSTPTQPTNDIIVNDITAHQTIVKAILTWLQRPTLPNDPVNIALKKYVYSDKFIIDLNEFGIINIQNYNKQMEINTNLYTVCAYKQFYFKVKIHYDFNNNKMNTGEYFKNGELNYITNQNNQLNDIICKIVPLYNPLLFACNINLGIDIQSKSIDIVHNILIVLYKMNLVQKNNAFINNNAERIAKLLSTW